MRLIAALCTLSALAAAGYAGYALWLVWQDPLPAAQTRSAQPADPGLALQVAEPREPLFWPPLFGEPQPPKPPEPEPPQPPEPKEEPQPPRPPQPPVDSLGYTLQGLVADGDNRWAIVAHPTGDRLLRVGDTLTDGVTVVAIEADGLVLDNGGEEARLGFPE